MAGTCVLLHEQMDALLMAGLFLRGGAIGLLTLQAMTAALESTPKSLAATGILERISAMPGSAAVLVRAHLAPAAAVCFLALVALTAMASFSAVWRKQSAAFPKSRYGRLVAAGNGSPGMTGHSSCTLCHVFGPNWYGLCFSGPYSDSVSPKASRSHAPAGSRGKTEMQRGLQRLDFQQKRFAACSPRPSPARLQ